MNEDFPTSEGREERELLYYQWFPFILAFQMALMVMPRFFMKSFNSKTGKKIKQSISRQFKDFQSAVFVHLRTFRTN
jgi:hypothetical protein